MEIKDIATSRIGRFSSSSIHKLIKYGSRPMTESELKAHKEVNPKSQKKNIEDGFADVGITYITEKRYEKGLGLELESDSFSRPTSWGNLVEKRVFDLLPYEYVLESRTRFVSEKCENNTGAPDVLTLIKVGDIKSPFTRKAFCALVESMVSIEKFKEHSPEYYWQLVNNSNLTNRKIAEIIVYCPYKKELDIIREMATTDFGIQCKAQWIENAPDEQLPYLIEGNKYKNLNIFEFEVPQSDKDFLMKRVDEANKLLIA